MAAELIGHRGYREWIEGKPVAEQTPENSIAAFTNSFSPKGLDGVELDVHLSRDNKLVVFHDDDLNELTDVADLLRQPIPADGPDPLANVRGVDLTRLRALQANDPDGNGKLYIADLNLSEIQALRLKTHPDPGGVRHTAERHAIPTLTQVFEAVDAARATDPDRPFKITIEVKEASMLERRPTDWAVFTSEDGQPQRISKDIAAAVTNTVGDFLEGPRQAPWSKADNLVVSSFHKMTLGRLRAADPEIPRSALYSKFVERDFRVADGNLEMKDRGAENWTALRPVVPTDRLFSDFDANETQNERIWDMTEEELKQAIDADSQLRIVDFNGTELTGPDGKALVGVAPNDVSISISEMTEEVVAKIHSIGADVSVWTANEQPIEPRSSQERSELFNFLEAHGVRSFITDNSNNMVQARDAWLERKQAAELSQDQPAPQQTDPATALAQSSVPAPSVPAPSVRAPGRRSRDASPAPREPTPPQPPAPPLSRSPSPQRRTHRHIPLIPEPLPPDARPYNRRALFDAVFANGVAQTVAMCVAYGVALSYIQSFITKSIPQEGTAIGGRLLTAVAQGVTQGCMVAIWEEGIFGIAAEGWAAAMRGQVVPRGDPYPEFKLPPLAVNAQSRGLEEVRVHNRALEYARTHGGIQPAYEPQNHPFRRLVLHPEPGVQNYDAELANYDHPDQVELRRTAEGTLRNLPIELSDFPTEYDAAPRHVREERRDLLQTRHEAEVAYANDVISRPEYRQFGLEQIPQIGARNQSAALYDNRVEQAREFLEQRSRQLGIGRMAFTRDQRGADYGSFPIDSVLIGSFALFAGLNAAAFRPSTLQTTLGTTLAGTAFGALNNGWRLLNRHNPATLVDAFNAPQATQAPTQGPQAPPQPTQAPQTDVEMGRIDGAPRTPDSIPTHFVREGRGVQHGLEVMKETWNAFGDSERLSDGVLAPGSGLERARNQAQQLVSYVIGSSYGLVAYNVVRTAIDHAVGGSQGHWQSFLRETAATAAFVGGGDLAILHHSIYGRRGVTSGNPAYAATREAYADLWKTATGQEVHSTIDRNTVTKLVERAYDITQKAIRVTQHGLMDTADLATTPVFRAAAVLLGSTTVEQRAAETRRLYGQEAGDRTVYGDLPYKEREDVSRAAGRTAIQSLLGDKPLSDQQAVERLEVLRDKADKFWDAEQRLEALWREIGPIVAQGQQPPTPALAEGQQHPTLASTQGQQQPAAPAVAGVFSTIDTTIEEEVRADQPAPPVQPPIQSVPATQQPVPGSLQEFAQRPAAAEETLLHWQPTDDLRKRCEEVVKELKEAREAMETLRKAEISVRQTINEQAIETRLKSIAQGLPANQPAAEIPALAEITALMRRPSSGIDHKTFETMLNNVVQQNPAAAQHRDAMLESGRQGINERAVTMVSNAMTSLAQNNMQRPQDVAAVMTNLVDEAHGTGMSENQFNTIVRDQFREATQRTTDPTERIRLTAAEQETIRRTRERFTEVASVALNTRRKGLDNLEKAVDNKVTPTRAGRGGRR